MAKVSILIPSRGEIHEVSPGVTVLQRMVQDIYEQATGEFEVLVGFDGPPYQTFPDYPNLKLVKLPDPIGLKPMVNMLAGLATGKYLYKSDSHCSFGKGFDEILQADMEDNWLVTPRFYVLDPYQWAWQDERYYDYFYLSCPLTDPDQFKFKAGGHWPERTKEREDGPQLDETIQMHGSGWFVTKDFFWNCLKGMSSEGYDNFGMEPPELCLKTWLGPWEGKVMVNKKTWYAHMHKGKAVPRGWPLSKERIFDSYDFAANYWMNDTWKQRKHNIEWLIEKFMPMPTWPDNWWYLMKQRQMKI